MRLDQEARLVATQCLAKASNALEVHGKKSLLSRRGQAATVGLFQNLISIGCIPLFVMAEKRYCIGGKIVETYLDHWDNPRVSNLLQWDLEAKQVLAAHFSRLPEDVIRIFAVGYREANPDLLRQALLRIVNCMRLQMRFELADVLMGCFHNIDSIAETEQRALLSMPGGAMASLNLPVFVSFASLADNLGTAANLSRGVVVHDETREYEQTFRWIFEAYRDAQPGKVRFLGGQEQKFGYDSLKKFITVPSHSEPMIQAADRLAAAIRLYAVQALREQQVLPAIAEMAVQILPFALLGEPQIGSIIGVDSFDSRFWEPIRTALKAG